MKTLLRILGGVVLLVAVALSAVFCLSAGMVKVADGFLAAVKVGDHPNAIPHLSEEFRAPIPASELVALMDRSALRQVKSVSWTSRAISPGHGDLEGTATMDSGGSIRLKAHFVKENGEWRIQSLDQDKSGAADAEGSELITDPKTAAILVHETMQQTALSIKSKDVSPLLGRAQFAESESRHQQLQQALKPFMDKEIDLTGLASIAPDIKKPFKDEMGRMVLAGYFQADEATRVKFSFAYRQALLAWKFIASSCPSRSPSSGTPLDVHTRRFLAPSCPGSKTSNLYASNGSSAR